MNGTATMRDLSCDPCSRLADVLGRRATTPCAVMAVSRRCVLDCFRHAASGLLLLPVAPTIAAMPIAPVARPVRILIGYPPASTLDVVARTIALKLQARFGARFVVENRTGAAGRIAIDALRATKANGSAMLLAPDWILGHGERAESASSVERQEKQGTNSIATGATLERVAVVASSAIVLAAGPLVPASVNTLIALREWLNARGRPVACGDEGPGSFARTLATRLGDAAGLRLLPVGYRGEIMALREAAAGAIALAFGSEGAVGPFVRAGRLRALALTGRTRSRFMPGVPTFAESDRSFPGERERFVLALRAGTPEPVIDSLRAAIAAVLRDGEVREIWSRLALSVDSATFSIGNAAPGPGSTGLR